MPGRPREVQIDHVVLAATTRLLAKMSFAHLSIELVAKEARVGKAAVYRRWPSKAALVADAVARFAPTPRFEAGGDIGESTRAGLVAFASAMTGSEIGHVLYSLLGEAFTDPDLGQILRERYLAPRQQLIEEALRRCVDAGVIRSDITLSTAQSLLLGPLTHGWIISGQRPDQRYMTEVIATAWEALRP